MEESERASRLFLRGTLDAFVYDRSNLHRCRRDET